MKLTPPEFREYIARRIKSIQRTHGFTATKMQEIMCIGQHVWAETLNCRREVKAIEIYRLAQHVKCDVSYFYPWED